jgi:hypothetical protein
MIDQLKCDELSNRCKEIVYKKISHGPIISTHSYIYINYDARWGFSLNPGKSLDKMIFRATDFSSEVDYETKI